MKIDAEKLRLWINTLNYDDFSNKDVICKGYSVDDYNNFKEVREKLLDEDFINYGDYLIVDLEGHLVLGKWTRRKYKLSSGRLVPIKIIEKLKKNDDPCVNGYWIVPKRFQIH